MYKTLITLVFSIFVAACHDESSSTGGDSRIQCEAPRPEICTTIYAPVCGTLIDGTQQTFASDCTACAVKEVVSFMPGACE
jgi:hypothetical protein